MKQVFKGYKNNGILSHSRACKPEHEEDIVSMTNEASSYIEKGFTRVLDECEEKYPKGYRYMIDIDRDYLINALMEDIECRR